MSEQPKLPIKVARDIAADFGWDQVIIVARKVGDDGCEHVVTYGNGRDHSEVAARAGNAIKHHLMKWPSALFDSTLNVLGVGRDHDRTRSLYLWINREASDDDIRMVHEMLTPPTKTPDEIEKGE